MKVSNNLKILFLIGTYYPVLGGTEKQCMQLVRELVAKNCAVTILTSFRRKEKVRNVIDGSTVLRLPIAVGVPRFILAHKKRVPFYGMIEMLWEFFSGKVGDCLVFFFLIMYRNKFDVLHLHNLSWKRCGGAARLAKKLNKGVILKIMSILEVQQAKATEIKLANRCDFIICTSTDIYNGLLEKGIPESKLYACPNGVVLPKETVTENNFQTYQVTTIGNLHQHPHKGLDVLLKSWVHVVQKFPRAKLVIVGSDDSKTQNYRGYFERFVRELNISNSVTFTGRLPNPNAVLLKSHIFVLPSRIEGLSNALLEAMACGLPCVATNISGNRDLIPCTQIGILVPVEDSNSLADAIVYLFEHPDEAKKMGAEARCTIEKRYRMEDITARYLNLYTSLGQRQ